jgi:hypothetical protein
MLALKIFIFCAISIIAIIVLIKHVNGWGVLFREYMLGQANKTFGNGVGWQRPWTLMLSKAMVVFFGLMFLTGVYVLIFS